MDNFTYQYNGITNRLDHVDDSVPDSGAAQDLQDQANGNYKYNSIGQLVKNNQDNIEYIYNASGLVTQIKQDGEPKVNILYDDKGKRYKKEVKVGDLWLETYYMRDASGQVTAIYSGNYGNGTVVNPKAEEYPIYGASRLGVAKRSGSSITSTLYQFTDHLGNVRAVIVKDAQGNAAALTHATDCYPGGMAMPGRQIVGDYRYGYQGEFAEKDEETGHHAFELRLYDSRINRWMAPDPAQQYPSPYMSMGNNWVSKVDPDGAKADDYLLPV